MKYKVFARMRGKSKAGCFATYYGATQKAAAEKHAQQLASYPEYSRVRLVEIPDEEDNRPYSKKEVIYKA